MSVRHLEALLAPRSVAVLGVSPRAGNLGAIVLRNLRQGGFQGPIWPVNRHDGEVDGLHLWPDIASLPGVPDLAVLCTPAAAVPALIRELGEKGTRAAIVLTAGLKQPVAAGGPTLEQAMLEAARPFTLRILGPNCIGALVPGAGLNASFAPGSAQDGQLAFVTQSGALATAMLDWANGQGIGFSHFISLGDSADVDFGDLLDYLASDARTRAILMYVESVKGARKFMSAARAAARNKPVIVVKAGRAPEGARAAASHTGAMAGSDTVFDAAVRRAGMLRVDSLDALFDAARTLAGRMPWRGDRLALITNGGGAGVLAADALALGGGRLAELSEATLAALDAVLPTTWSHGNPVDIIGDAPVERYQDALRVLVDAPEVDGVLFMHAPTAIVPATAIAEACLPLLAGASKPVLSCWLGGPSVLAARQAFTAAGVPCHPTPEHAVAGWLQLARYHQGQKTLLELPDDDPVDLAVDVAAAREVMQAALKAGQEWLDEADAKAVLTAFGIPTVPTRRVHDAEEAVEAARQLGFPVALKIVSPEITHKSDVGGVALDLHSAEDLLAAAARMRQRVSRDRPHARVLGFTVQAMVRRPRARELIIGVTSDPVFGPVLLFGAGGTAVELLGDRAVGLPPLNAALADGLVTGTRVGRLLAGFRGEAAADQAAVRDVLLRVSRMACDLPELSELDINPLLADAQGVVALDARVRLRQPVPGEPSRLALRPFPRHLEQTVELAGRTLLVRPIRPEDGSRMAAFYADAPSEDLRLRFFFSRREVPRSELARYCQIDYDRDVTLVAIDGEAMVGEVRAVCDPDNEQAEFAIQVHARWQRQGLGRWLMNRLLAVLRARGTGELVGQCLAENTGMVELARATGFATRLTTDGTWELRQRLR